LERQQPWLELVLQLAQVLPGPVLLELLELLSVLLELLSVLLEMEWLGTQL
jgi:hypothetical protein